MGQPPLPAPGYKYFHEGNNPIDNEAMSLLGQFHRLKELILWGCGITAGGVKVLSDSQLELETLNLGTD